MVDTGSLRVDSGPGNQAIEVQAATRRGKRPPVLRTLNPLMRACMANQQCRPLDGMRTVLTRRAIADWHMGIDPVAAKPVGREVVDEIPQAVQGGTLSLRLTRAPEHLVGNLVQIDSQFLEVEVFVGRLWITAVIDGEPPLGVRRDCGAHLGVGVDGLGVSLYREASWRHLELNRCAVEPNHHVAGLQ